MHRSFLICFANNNGRLHVYCNVLVAVPRQWWLLYWTVLDPRISRCAGAGRTKNNHWIIDWENRCPSSYRYSIPHLLGLDLFLCCIIDALLIDEEGVGVGGDDYFRAQQQQRWRLNSDQGEEYRKQQKQIQVAVQLFYNTTLIIISVIRRMQPWASEWRRRRRTVENWGGER